MSEIKLTFMLEQFCNDLLTKCNNVSKTIRDEALADIKADVSNPDGEETRSIICRACTEAFGNVKYAAQRFMKTGRTEDSNILERLVSSIDEETGAITYEEIVLDMSIPNYNTSATDTLKWTAKLQFFFENTKLFSSFLKE